MWFGLKSDPPSTDSDIEEIESSLGIELSPEYEEFLKNFGGGYFAFTNVFSGMKGSKWYIIAQNNKAGLLALKEFLAISENGFGDFYGYKVKNGKCESRISFYDHESDIIESTEYENVFTYLLKVGLSPN